MTRRSRRRAGALAITAALSAAVVLAPARAQEDVEPGIDFDALKDRLDRAWDSVVDGLEPAIDRLSRTLAAMERIDSLEHYEDPVVLDNGDILIRRKADAPPLPPEETVRGDDEGVRL
ncbi:MAG: hypothetical protein ACFBWO_06970 [Paracoccaceae bacterium]